MVNDRGEFVENISIKEAKDQDYACGMFWFKRLFHRMLKYYG